MAWTDLLPPFPDLLVQSIQDEGPHLTITLVSTRLSDTCPTCQTHTQAGHGWFTRQVHSLPCSGRAVVFQIHARRFRCPNAACPRCTFREDLSSVATRYQRRTPAATRLLQRVGAEVGGQAGVRIAKCGGCQRPPQDALSAQPAPRQSRYTAKQNRFSGGVFPMALFPPDHPTITKPALLERLLAAGAHVSSFVAPFLAPLLLWLILRWWLPFAAQHARHALVTHLLTLLTIGVLSLLALVVFLLGLEGTVSVPPTGGTLQVVYLSVFVLLVVAAFLAWLVGQIRSISGAIRALQGKPAHTLWRKRH